MQNITLTHMTPESKHAKTLMQTMLKRRVDKTKCVTTTTQHRNKNNNTDTTTATNSN